MKLAPDDYAVPNPRLPGRGENPDFIRNFESGPAFHMTVMNPGNMNMGKYIFSSRCGRQHAGG